MTATPSFTASNERALLGTGALAAAAFAILTSRTLEPKTILSDLRLRRLIPGYHKKAKKAAFHFGTLGRERAVLPAAAILAGYLMRRGRNPGAAAVVVASAGGVAASHIFDVTLPQKTPPPGRRAPFDPHFPSGHALHSASFLAIAAWVLTREGLVPGKRAAGIATALALSLGVDRLIADRHWPTDVVGGWLAAAAIAAVTGAGYERLSRPARARRKNANRGG